MRPPDSWKKLAAYAVVGGVVLIAGTAMVTLAVTHNSAQTQNLMAYLNGWSDGVKLGGWIDGWTAGVEACAEHGAEALLGQ